MIRGAGGGKRERFKIPVGRAIRFDAPRLGNERPSMTRRCLRAADADMTGKAKRSFKRLRRLRILVGAGISGLPDTPTVPNHKPWGWADLQGDDIDPIGAGQGRH